MPIFSKIVGFFCGNIAIVNLIPLGLLTENIGVGCTELFLVEAVPEFLAALGHFLLYFLLNLAKIILNEDIGPIALFGVFIVNEGVVEGSYVAGCLPDAGVHEDGAVNAHDVLIQAGHGFPPVVLDVVFELYAHLAIVIDSGQSVVDLRGGENESVLLAMGYKHLEKFVLCHTINTIQKCQGRLRGFPVWISPEAVFLQSHALR